MIVFVSRAHAQPDFPLGEKITFRVKFGWLTLGKASMSLGGSVVSENGKEYYESYIEAKTVGPLSWVAGIENSYWGLVGTENFQALRSEKHLDEKDGKVDQWNEFEFDKLITHVKMIEHGKGGQIKEKQVRLRENTYDLHGTYMYLRKNLWSGYGIGDSLLLSTYWGTKLYDFGMEYAGAAKVKFDGKKYLAHKFYGLFPVSSTFPKERAVSLFVFEKNGIGIPLLIEAELKIGKVKCELKSYQINGKEEAL